MHPTPLEIHAILTQGYEWTRERHRHDPDAPGKGYIRAACEQALADLYPQWGGLRLVCVEVKAKSDKYPDREFGGRSSRWALCVNEMYVGVREVVPWSDFVERCRSFMVDHRDPKDVLRVEVIDAGYLLPFDIEMPWEKTLYEFLKGASARWQAQKMDEQIEHLPQGRRGRL